MSARRAARIGVVGARRVHQGLGPFVIRDLTRAGAEVPCFAVTSRASAREASARIEAELGLAPRAYTEPEQMLARESLDALAILSPAGTHGAWLDRALQAGLHVLCEKPFLWDEAEAVAHARRLVEGFHARDLLLVENCQWPETLATYGELHGRAADAPPPERFEMRLSPDAAGRQLLGDALPHPLSLLQALVPAERASLDEITFSSRDPGARELEVGFVYVPGGAGAPQPVRCRITLVPGPVPPREAGYALDGRWARRRIRLEDYAQSLSSGTQEVDLPDPLTRLVGRFVRDLESRLAIDQTPRPPSDPAIPPSDRILQRMELLFRLVASYEGNRA